MNTRELRTTSVEYLDADECLKLLAHSHPSNTTEKRRELWRRYCKLSGLKDPETVEVKL